MFNRYFQQELDNLKELGTEFSKAHPALAPMLSGRSTDPDVDRLLEGVAFLTGLLRQKLDDGFPEIIHELVQLIWPHYLHPLPCTSIVEFTPKPILKNPMIIPKGTQLASIQVEDTSCLFQTCYPVEVNPLEIREASLLEKSGQSPAIRLSMELLGPELEEWQPESLRLFLGSDYPAATDLYLILMRFLKQIRIRSENGSELILLPENLTPVGFAADEGIIPYPTNSFPGYRTIQEYFILPEKFLFLDITGWEQWQNRGTGHRFEIIFDLKELPFTIPKIKKTNFVLSATPVINIFPFDADPVRLDHRKSEYRIRPSSRKETHYQIYSVEKVTGFVQGTAEEKNYLPFELFKPETKENPVYHVNIRQSPVWSGYDLYLSTTYSLESDIPASETLSIKLLCTNGYLPEALRPGDISLPTGSSPEQVTFKNLTPPTSYILPPIGKDLLWKMISHLSLNYASLADTKNIQELLSLYLFHNPQRPEASQANKKRIAGINSIQSTGTDRLVSGVLMRGRDITLKAGYDHYAGQGDLFLFGSMLNYFLGSYASINTFTRFSLKEIVTGEVYKWPAKVGNNILI